MYNNSKVYGYVCNLTVNFMSKSSDLTRSKIVKYPVPKVGNEKNSYKRIEKNEKERRST